jgi:glutamate--cysteine ligase catalytic subunit
MTTARWIRNFVTKHEAYKQDSVVTDEISYDLIHACDKITRGELKCPDLLPSYDTKTKGTLPSALQKEDVYLERKRKSVTNGETIKTNTV